MKVFKTYFDILKIFQTFIIFQYKYIIYSKYSKLNRLLLQLDKINVFYKTFTKHLL